MDSGLTSSAVSELTDRPVDVKCYSGFKANERPLSFTFCEREFSVMDIEGSWFEQDAAGVKEGYVSGCAPTTATSTSSAAARARTTGCYAVSGCWGTRASVSPVAAKTAGFRYLASRRPSRFSPV